MTEIDTPYLRLEIDQLRAEIADLNGHIADLTAAQQMEMDSTTEHITWIYRRMTEMNEYLFAVVHKMYPKYKADLKRIDELLRLRLEDKLLKPRSPTTRK